MFSPIIHAKMIENADENGDIQKQFQKWHNACVIGKGNYRIRKTLESWHTAKTVDTDNNSKPLPRQYSILL